MKTWAHYKIGGRHVVLLDAQRLPNGAIRGTAVGSDNGFTRIPDRVVTLDPATVRKYRVKLESRS